MNFNQVIPFLLFLFVVPFVYGQTSKPIDLSLLDGQEREGEKNFQVFAYRKAIFHYEKAYEDDTNNLQVLYRLAQCYYFMRDFVDAEYYASKVIYKKDYSTDTEIYNYFEILIVNKKYDEAIYWYNKLKERPDVNPFYLSRMEGVLLFKDYKGYSKLYQIEPLPFNSEYSDFGLTYFEDTIVFLSNRSKKNKLRKAVKDNQMSYFKLYKVIKVNENEYSDVKNYGDNIINGYHIGPLSYYDNNTKVIFTQSHRREGGVFGKDVQEDSDGVIQLELYIGDVDKDKIKDIEPFPYNNIEFSNAHPTVSQDGKTLVFSSNRADGIGKSDLYLCKKLNNTWSPPINLGGVINTPGSELFPYLNGNTLYFASDGHDGMGQLDIYKVVLVDNKATQIINLGYPINSNYDDFGFITKDGYSGYFCTNRGSSANDQIYSFEAKDTLPDNLKIIKVYDSLTNKLVKSYSLEVNLLDSSNLSLLPVKTFGDSIFEYHVNDSINYEVLAESEGYVNQYKIFEGSKESPWEIYLNKISVGQKVELRNIYYDFDKASLRDSSRIELNKLIVWMEKNPKVSVKIIAYTDNWGSSEYNQKLSEDRALTAYNYLVESGIQKERLSYEGKGDKEPVFVCPQPKDCNRYQHQANRRTEFEIISNKNNIE